MRNRKVDAYRKQISVPTGGLRRLKEKVDVQVERARAQEIRHLEELEEQVRAAEDLAKAQEDLERARARLSQIEIRRGKL